MQARSVLVSLSFAAVVIATTPVSAFADGTVVEKPLGSTAAPFGYLEYLPPGYDTSPNASYPIVVALAGIGELGDGTTQLENVASNGPIKMIKGGSTYFADHNVIVIAPQAPDQWEFDPQLASMQAFLPYLSSTYRVNPARVYMTGLSAGGGGVYTFVGDGYGTSLAAVIAICGNQDPYDPLIPPFATVPLWSFQNWGDTTNPRARPIGWTTKIAQHETGSTTLDVMTGYPNKNGDTNQPAADPQTAVFDGTSFSWASGVDSSGNSDLRLTLYPGSDHDAWTVTYSNTAVWDWLLAHGDSSSSSSATTTSGSSTSASGTPSASVGATTGAGSSSAGSGGAGGASSGAGNETTPPESSTGCSVDASGSPTKTNGLWAGLTLLGIVVGRRRLAQTKRRHC